MYEEVKERYKSGFGTHKVVAFFQTISIIGVIASIIFLIYIIFAILSWPDGDLFLWLLCPLGGLLVSGLVYCVGEGVIYLDMLLSEVNKLTE